MLELICSIPNSVGWAIASALIAFNVTLAGRLIGYAIEFFKEDEDSDE